MCTHEVDASLNRVVLDLDRYDALMEANSEVEIEALMERMPLPVSVISVIPRRHRNHSIPEIQGVAAEVLSRIQRVAPEVYRRWSAQHRTR